MLRCRTRRPSGRLASELLNIDPKALLKVCLGCCYLNPGDRIELGPRIFTVNREAIEQGA